MKKIRKYVNRGIMVLAAANMLLLSAGCGKTESDSHQTVMEGQNQGLEGQNAADDAGAQGPGGDTIYYEH